MTRVGVAQVVGWLDELYEIGSGAGANRLGFSDAEDEAHERVREWMVACSLETRRDSAGNLYGRRPGADRSVAELWIGSHLDSVPNGGRFDGALGVIGGIAAVANLERDPPLLPTVVAFRDEEGARFGRGFFGSRAVCGQVTAGDLDQRDANGVRLGDALDKFGFVLGHAGRWLSDPPAAYLEMHIEQGPVLALRDAPVGIVSSFVGLIELRVEFAGSAAHAGTTPMHARRDAGRAASAFHVAVNAIAERNGDVVATIGVLELEPGASNVVPGRARAIVDARAQDVPKLDALESAIRQAAGQAAAETRCSVEVVKSLHVAPVPAAPMVVDALRKAAPTAPVLPSGAGHDAQVLAAAGVPTGMVFVRSLADGASHSPAEHTDVADIATAIDTLQRATEFLSPATAD